MAWLHELGTLCIQTVVSCQMCVCAERQRPKFIYWHLSISHNKLRHNYRKPWGKAKRRQVMTGFLSQIRASFQRSGVTSRTRTEGLSRCRRSVADRWRRWGTVRRTGSHGITRMSRGEFWLWWGFCVKKTRMVTHEICWFRSEATAFCLN